MIVKLVFRRDVPFIHVFEIKSHSENPRIRLKRFDCDSVWLTIYEWPSVDAKWQFSAIYQWKLAELSINSRLAAIAATDCFIHFFFSNKIYVASVAPSKSDFCSVQGIWHYVDNSVYFHFLFSLVVVVVVVVVIDGLRADHFPLDTFLSLFSFIS